MKNNPLKPDTADNYLNEPGPPHMDEWLTSATRKPRAGEHTKGHTILELARIAEQESAEETLGKSLGQTVNAHHSAMKGNYILDSLPPPKPKSAGDRSVRKGTLLTRGFPPSTMPNPCMYRFGDHSHSCSGAVA